MSASTFPDAGSIRIGGDLSVRRIGLGAMRLTGDQVWGEYPDHDGGVAQFCSSTRCRCWSWTLPFATSVLAQALRSGHGQRTAAGFYAIAFAVTAVTSNVVWQYACRHRLLSEALGGADATAISGRFQLAVGWLVTGALLGAVLPVLGVAVSIAFNAFYLASGPRRESAPATLKHDLTPPLPRAAGNAVAGVEQPAHGAASPTDP